MNNVNNLRNPKEFWRRRGYNAHNCWLYYHLNRPELMHACCVRFMICRNCDGTGLDHARPSLKCAFGPKTLDPCVREDYALEEVADFDYIAAKLVLSYPPEPTED